MILVHVLGAPVIRRPDGPITGRAAHRRRLGLLAILAAARGRPVGRERIIGLLWPESSADAARHTLSEALYVLRKDLGEDTFVVVGDEVGLDPARARTDLDDFQRALDEGRWEEAVRAYGGPFLEGFYVSDAPEFERWAEEERDRLARGYARALEELALAAEAAGAPLRAAEWWRRLLGHDAFSSRVALRLVRALERAGERAAALRAAEAHVLLLRQELGVGPDPELAALIEELRAAPPAPAPRPAPAPPADADRHPPASDTVAETAVLGRAGEDGDGAEDAARLTRSIAADRPGGTRRGRWMGIRAAAGLLAVGAATAIAALAAGRDRGPRQAEYDPRRIAVLYLDDDSPNGDLQYLASGLTEMLIHELSQVEALEVVSRNGVKPYRQGTVPFDSIVAQLRVGSVVEGSVMRSADSVRVVVQLIDGNTGAHLESKEVVRPLGDLLALQRDVSEQVSGFLRGQLGEQVRLRQAERETRSPQALDLVLRGEQAYADALELRRGSDPRDVASALRALVKADGLLARAEAADPRWTRPTVGRAWVSAQEAAWSDPIAAPAAFDSALARAGRVLAREPANARALEARGTALWNAALAPGADPALMDAAERDLNAAVTAEPTLASAWGRLSLLLNTRGRLAESAQAVRRALEHDAWLEDADRLLDRSFYDALNRSDYRTAAEMCERGRAAFPRDWRFLQCRLTLLREDPSLPADTALAWRLASELDAMDPPARAAAASRAYATISRQVAVAVVMARAGHADRARAVLARARLDAAVDPESQVALALDQAYVLLILGDRDEARRQVQVYLAQRPTLRDYVARDPQLAPLLTSADTAR